MTTSNDAHRQPTLLRQTKRTCISALTLLLWLAFDLSSVFATHYVAVWLGLDGDWTNASLWSTTDYPHNNGDDYDAVINGGNVNLNAGVVVDNLTLTGGTLIGAQDITIDQNFTWQGGVLGGNGNTNVAGLSMTGDLQLDDSRRLVNYGTGSYSGDNQQWSCTNGAYFRNASSGHFTLAGDSNYVGGSLYNDGTLIKTAGGTGGTTFIDAYLNNTGTVDVQSGASFMQGGFSGGSGSLMTGTGTVEFRAGHFSVASDSSISATSVWLTGGTTQFDGSYSVTHTSITGGTHSFGSESVDTTTLDFTEGVLSGGGQFDIHGHATWSGGAMGGSGLTTFLDTLSISGSVALQDSRFIDLRGQATLSSDTGDITNTSSSTFGIDGSGQLTFASDADFLGGKIENGGHLIKQTGGDDGVTQVTAQLRSLSASTVDVQSGTLSLAQGGEHDGSFTVQGPGVLDFSGGNHTLNSSASVGGTGTARFSGGSSQINASFSVATTNITGGNHTFLATQTNLNQLVLSGGTMQGSGEISVNGAFIWSDATIEGTGKVKAHGGMVLSNYPKLRESCEIENYGVARVITDTVIASDPMTQFSIQPGADLIFETDADYGHGTIKNYGRLIKRIGIGESRFNASVWSSPQSETIAETGVLHLAGGGIHGGATIKSLPNARVEFSGDHSKYQTNIIALDAPEGFAAGGGGGSGMTVPRNIVYVDGASLWDDAVDISGNGFVAIEGGTVDAGDDSADVITAENVAIVGGALNGRGTLDINGMFVFHGGTMGGDGITNLIGDTELNGEPELAGDRIVNNSGNATFVEDTGRLTQVVGSAPVFNNLPSGQFLFDGDSDYLALTFNNQGTLIKRAGADGSSAMSVMNNTGVVQTESGTLAVTAGGTHTGSFGGTGTLELGGVQHLQGSSHVSVNNMRFSGVVDVDGSYNVQHTEVVAGEAKFNATASTQTLEISSVGSVSGSGTLNVAGSTTWTGGGMRGSGVTNAMGPIDISGTVSLDGTRILNNFVQATYSGDFGQFWNFPGTSTLHNQSGAQFTFAGDSDYRNGTIINDGTLTKQAGGSDGRTLIDATLNNAGIVEIPSGTLALGKGGNHTGQFVGNGRLEISGGNHQFQAESSIAVLQVQLSGGTNHFAGTYDVLETTITDYEHHFDAFAVTDALALDFGTLHGAGTLNVTGTMTWNGGGMRGGGITNAQSHLLVNGAVFLQDTRTLNSGGTASVEGDFGGFYNGNHTTFNNLSSADLTFAGDSDYFSGAFNNDGVVIKQAGVTDGVTEISAFVSNTGTIDVQSGSLYLSGGFAQTAGLLNVSSGAGLRSDASLNVQSGVLALGDEVTIDADVSLSGRLRLGNSTGDATIDGNYTQAAGGTLEIEIGGRTVGGGYDRLNTTGNAILQGGLQVSLINLGNGIFSPVAGDSFEILAADGDLIAAFQTQDLPILGGGLSWNVNYDYTAANVILEILATYLEADFNEDGNVDGDDFLTWQGGFGIGSGAAHSQGDADADGDVDGDDFLIWQTQFGSGSGSANAAVPEPQSLMLLFVVLVGAVFLSRRLSFPITPSGELATKNGSWQIK